MFNHFVGLALKELKKLYIHEVFNVFSSSIKVFANDAAFTAWLWSVSEVIASLTRLGHKVLMASSKLIFFLLLEFHPS